MLFVASNFVLHDGISNLFCINDPHDKTVYHVQEPCLWPEGQRSHCAHKLCAYAILEIFLCEAYNSVLHEGISKLFVVDHHNNTMCCVQEPFC